MLGWLAGDYMPTLETCPPGLYRGLPINRHPVFLDLTQPPWHTVPGPRVSDKLMYVAVPLRQRPTLTLRLPCADSNNRSTQTRILAPALAAESCQPHLSILPHSRNTMVQPPLLRAAPTRHVPNKARSHQAMADVSGARGSGQKEGSGDGRTSSSAASGHGAYRRRRGIV